MQLEKTKFKKNLIVSCCGNANNKDSPALVTCTEGGEIICWYLDINPSEGNKFLRHVEFSSAAKMMHRKTAMVMEQWKQYVLARVTQRKRVKRIVSRLCNGKLFMGFKHWVNVVEYINNGEARYIINQ